MGYPAIVVMPRSAETTLDGTTHTGDAQDPPGLRVSVLWHRDPRRIGASCWTPWSRAGDTVEISRQEPIFDDGAPLDDRHVSRSPLQLVASPTGLVCWPAQDRLKFDLDGVPGRAGASVSRAALTRGVRIGLGRGALVQVAWAPARVVARDPLVEIAVRAVESARVVMARRGRSWPMEGESAWLGRELMEVLLEAPWPDAGELQATMERLVERDLDRSTCGMPDVRGEQEAEAAPLPLAARADASAPISLRFDVSRDEEHVALTARWAGQTLRFEGRAHTYTLLTLARARLEAERSGRVPSAERGWVHRDTLCRQLRLDPNLLLTHLFRARRQLAAAGVPGAEALFERRLDAGQLRLGIADLEVVLPG